MKILYCNSPKKLRIKRLVVIMSFLLCFITNNVYARSEWLGKWQSEPIKEGTETAILEYHFKNDSVMSMSFVTDNHIVGVGRCVSKCSIKGTYSKYGPFFEVSLDPNTLNVSLLNFVAISTSATKNQILSQLRTMAKTMFDGYDNVRMIYVTHDSPDIISFIYGDESNAMEMEFHRSNKPLEQLLDIKESIGDTVDSDADCKESLLTKNKDQSEEGYGSQLYTENDQLIYDENKESCQETTPMVKMWKSMGIFMLYLIMSFIVIYGSKYLFVKNISRKNSANKSVRIRRVYYCVRFVLRILLMIIGLLVWGILLFDAMQVNKYIAMSIMCGGGGLLLSLMSSVSLPVSVMTMKDILMRKRPFVLYLRGFVTDNYSPAMEEYADKVSNATPWKYKTEQDPTKLNPNLLPLKEKAIAESWKWVYPIYSVGLPEELESPEGTKRIYLDNETWQDNAITLMKLAKYILVRVHSNTNCVWEIGQCNSHFSDKTIYYIDDINKLESVKQQMGEDLPMCLRSESLKSNHMIAYQINNEIITKSYRNNEDGLCMITREILRVVDKSNTY